MEFTVEKNRISKTDETGKAVAEILFPAIDANTVDITHTFVDPSLAGQGIAGLGKPLEIRVYDSNEGGADLGRGPAGIRVYVGQLLRQGPLFKAFPRPLGKVVGILEDVLLEEILVRVMKYGVVADGGNNLPELPQVDCLPAGGLEDADALAEFKRPPFPPDHLFHDAPSLI